MKILVVGDVHFCQYSSILRSRGEQYSTRLENCIKSLNWAERVAEDKNCEYIIHLGDFLDRPDLNAEEITALKEIKWADKKHFFIVGNHELALNDLSYNSTQVLNNVPKCKIVDKPMDLCGYGYSIVLLPYILESSRKPLSEYINDLYKDMFTTQEVKNTIIFSHNDIKGLRYGQFESKVGFTIEEIEKECSLYINGHLHNQQQVTRKILNLGNLTGQNFSEDAEIYSHSIAVVDTDTLDVELITNPYALKFYKFNIETDDFSILDKCDEYSLLTIKTYSKYIDDIRKYLADKKVCCYRILTVPEISNKGTEEIKELWKVDHLQQFKDFVLSNLDNSDVLKEELSLLGE